MLKSELLPSNTPPLPVVCAVSYLNTTPLVWGFEHTALGQSVRLEYALPSECADRVRAGQADIGLVPVIEIERQGLEWLPEVGIACEGAVRSILLVSKVPLDQVKLLATDVGSRTSVILSRIILAERYGAEPGLISMAPDLDAMLRRADAALVLGDPALHLNPEELRDRYQVLDLGEEWTGLTGLPMIFALWAGTRIPAGAGRLFAESYAYGAAHIDDIVGEECLKRQLPEALTRRYLTRHIAFDLKERHHAGMRRYLRAAADLASLRDLRTLTA